MSEKERGCGYRMIGGLYLAGDKGQLVSCDSLPLELIKCGCCDYQPKLNRGFRWLTEKYVCWASAKTHEKRDRDCSCSPSCPICFRQTSGPIGLMFVGQTYYTPQNFVKEALELGVCKRISEIPNKLVLGESWIFLAHRKVPLLDNKLAYEEKGEGLLPKEPEYKEAVFYAFKPQRVEMPLWKGSFSAEELDLIRAHGITPVLLDPTPKNKKLHKRSNINVVLMLEKWAAEERAKKEKEKKKK